MRLNELSFKSHNPLLESIVNDMTPNQKYIVENIVNEVRLSMDQINQLFGQVQQGAVAAGSNRTLVGKGVDAGRAANAILNKMGTWLKNTTPVQNFDQKFKDLKANIRQNLGDNSTVIKTIDALGQFAKENPMKTAAVVGVLTAVAGIATGPVGGAIAGQVLRGSVELLKGADLSTAIGKGAKTAAVGAALGALVPGGADAGGADAGGGVVDTDVDQMPKKTGISAIDQGREALRGKAKLVNQYADMMGLEPGQHKAKFVGGIPVEIDGKPVPQNLYTQSDLQNIKGARDMAVAMGNPDPLAGQPSATGAAQGVQAATDTVSNIPSEISGNKKLADAYKSLVDKIQSTPNYNVRNLPNDIANRFGLDPQREAPMLSLAVQKAGGGSMQGFIDTVKNAAVKENAFIDYRKTYQNWRLNEGKQERIKIYLNQEGINTVFHLVSEGLWDKAKQTAKNVAGKAMGAVANKAAQVGSNLTNKVTADKLMTTWKKYGSPTESDKIYDILTKAGVDEKIVQKVYSDMKIATPSAPAAASPTTAAPTSTTPTPAAQPSAAQPAAAASTATTPAAPATAGAGVKQGPWGPKPSAEPQPQATKQGPWGPRPSAQPTAPAKATPAPSYGTMKPTTVTAKPAPVAVAKPMSYSGQVKATMGQPAQTASTTPPAPKSYGGTASATLGNKLPPKPRRSIRAATS